MRSFDFITDKLDTILQREIEVIYNDRPIRRGVFILYTVKDYHLTLIIKTPTTNKTYDMLYPFNAFERPGEIVLDYDIANIAHKKVSTDLTSLISEMDCNKFLDTTLTIKY
jgi:hypothetical protein